MQQQRYFLALFLLTLSSLCLNAQVSDPARNLQTISFGSCNNQAKPQPMWQFVLQNDPDLWVWLGDNIYGDSENMKVMALKYNKQKRNPEYVKLRKHCPIIGTWDDHDYGLNDGGKEHRVKRKSQHEFFNFFNVPATDPIRKQEGVYQSYFFGEGARKVKVILLDTRYFRDSLQVMGQARKKYCVANQEGDILGEAQWAWLEQELANSDAAINLLCTSIQFIPTQHNFEKWANFPKARARLFQLITATQPNKLILLSGDRHIAEVSRFDLEGLDYPLYEITSSGITHTWHEVREEDNRYRQGELIIRRNFGLLRIDWRNEDAPKVITEIRGLGNKLFLQEYLEW